MKAAIAKILLIVMLCGMIVTMCASCGNKAIIDTKWTYNVAYITIGNDTVKVEVASWRDYSDGDQIQVVDKNGYVWLSNSTNIVLVRVPEE